MPRWLSAYGLLCALFASSGCGTSKNFNAAPVPDMPGICLLNKVSRDSEVWPRYYGGVQMDICGLVKLADNPAEKDKTKTKNKTLSTCLLLIDSGGSLIADTATLPIVLGIDLAKHPEHLAYGAFWAMNLLMDGLLDDDSSSTSARHTDTKEPKKPEKEQVVKHVDKPGTIEKGTEVEKGTNAGKLLTTENKNPEVIKLIVFPEATDAVPPK